MLIISISVFVQGRPFQLSLMFAGKAGSMPYTVTPEIGWMGQPGTNTLAYYKHWKITEVKSFITLCPGANVIKL